MVPRSPKFTSKDSKEEEITVTKIQCGDKRYKYPIPHSVLTQENLPKFLATLLKISDEDSFVISRLSKSAKSWCVLESPASYQKLRRALTVKRRLQLKVTIRGNAVPEKSNDAPREEAHLAVEELSEKLMDFLSGESYSQKEKGATDQPKASAREAVPEEVFEKIGKFLADKGDFLSNISAYLAANSSVIADTVEQLVKDVQSKVVGAKELQDKIQSEMTNVFDKFSNDLQEKIVDAKELHEKIHAEVTSQVQSSLRKAQTEAKQAFESTFSEPKDGMQDIHKLIQSELEEFLKKGKRCPYSSGAAPSRPSRCPAKPQFYPPRSLSPGVYCDICSKRIVSTRYKCYGCADYDLCSDCICLKSSMHNPTHSFERIIMNAESPLPPPLFQDSQTTFASFPAHIHVECDGCDKAIVSGIRYKCLECPDYDLCEQCIMNRFFIHEGHRFVKVRGTDDILEGSASLKKVHTGIQCDGPLCVAANKYIYGIRYKCTSCSDFDLCASCEANPATNHNPEHIFVKIRNPVSLTVDLFKDQCTGVSHSSTVPVPPVPPSPPVPCIPVQPFCYESAVPTVPQSPVTNSAQDGLSSVVQLSEPISAKLSKVTSKAQIKVETVSVQHIVKSEASSVISITLRNTGDCEWPADTYISSGDNALGSSSATSFAVQPGQCHSFVLATYSSVSLEEVGAAKWKLVSREFEVPVEIFVKQQEKAEAVEESSSPVSGTLASSEVILPRLPIESTMLAGSTENLRNSSSSFYSAKGNAERTSQEAMNEFMSSNRFESDRSVTEATASSEDEQHLSEGEVKSLDSETMSESPELISATASPSIMAASISGADDDDDLLLDEDEMFTDSDYELVESEMA